MALCQTCGGRGVFRLSYPVPCKFVWPGYYLGYDEFPCPNPDCHAGHVHCCQGDQPEQPQPEREGEDGF